MISLLSLHQIVKARNFKNICLYETGKVVVSARAMSSDVR